MLTVTSEVATTAKLFLNLWKHECNRVIADRFTNQQDKDWFEKTLKQVIEEDFDAETATLLDAEPYFVDFMRDPPEPTGMKCVQPGVAWPLYKNYGRQLNWEEKWWRHKHKICEIMG